VSEQAICYKITFTSMSRKTQLAVPGPGMYSFMALLVLLFFLPAWLPSSASARVQQHY